MDSPSDSEPLLANENDRINSDATDFNPDNGFSYRTPETALRTPSIEIQGPKAPRKRQILATLISVLGPLQVGFVLGYSSPTIPELEEIGILDTEKATWYASIVTLGALAGALGGGYLISSSLGRKGTLVSCGPPFVASWVMIICAGLNKSYPLLLAGRIFGGITMGVVCIASPNYIAEIASPDMRGGLGTLFQVSVTLGVLLSYVLGIPLNWQWLAVAAASFAVLMSVLMLIVPETPRHLAAKQQDDKAREALRWLRGSYFNIDEEYRQIVENLELSPSSSIRIQDLMQRSILKPVLLILGVMAFQQSSGVNNVIFYTKDIFKSAHFNGDPAIPEVIIGTVQVVATVGSVFIMDKLGRKILLCVSGICMSLGCILLGLYYFLSQVKGIKGLEWLPILALILYISFFSIGWGPIPWTQMSELVPSRVKGAASSLAVIANWTCAFLVTKEFQAMQDTFTIYGTYWIFAGINAVGVIYVAFLVPETKGKSLEEIERLFI